MNRIRMVLSTTALAGFTVVVAVVGQPTASAQPALASPSGAPAGVVDHTGTMQLPIDYRTAYQFLGAWALAAETGPGSKEFHNVYASPGSIAAYRASGRFPDGSVLVKEVLATQTEDMTTGTVSRAADLVGWFMMVKDSRNSHSGNPLWGDGWGWAWCDKDSPAKTKTIDYQQECLSCHVPAQATDWIYRDGYSVLAR